MAQPDVPGLTDQEIAPTPQYADAYPVRFNQATREQLTECGLFTSVQVDYILNHRRQFGGFISKYELITIPGLTARHADAFRHFFILEELPLDMVPRQGSGPGSDNFMLLQARIRAGYGVSWRGRLEIQHNNWFGGLRFDQDFHETWRWDPSRKIWGADHVSASIRKDFHGTLNSVIVGEFNLHAGVGLVHSGAFFLGKGSLPPLPAATAYIRGRPSYTENEVKHGIAAQAEIKNLKVIVYGSNTRNDGVVYDDNSFRSLSNSGYHDSEAEQKKHNMIRHTAAGIILQQDLSGGHIGITSNIDLFSHRFHSTQSYNTLLPRGRVFFQGSVFGLFNRRNITYWFEQAIGSNAGLSGLYGASLGLGRYASLFLVFRNYGKAYLSFSGSSLSESSNGQRNERGLYAGMKFSRRKVLDVYTYIDAYFFPGETYRHAAGVRGIEFRINASRYFDRFELRSVSKAEHRNQSPGDALNGISTFKQQLHGYFSTRSLRSSVRIQYNLRSFAETVEHGWLVSAEQRAVAGKFSFSFQAIYFDTDSYYSREFVYERDVWGTFSLPSYFDKGFRGLIYVKWQRRMFTASVRGAVTLKAPSIPDKELKLQLKYAF